MRGRITTILVVAGACLAPVQVNAASLAEGALDTSFASDGARLVHFGAPGDTGFGEDVLVQPDGKIVISGESNVANAVDFTLARLKPNGALDPTFSGDGKVLTPISQGNDAAHDVALAPDGRIVAAGICYTGAYYADCLARYKPGGSLDTSFSGDGKRITDWGQDSSVDDVLVQPDGRIVTAGYRQTGPTEWRFSLTRYTQGGALDKTFAGDGSATTLVGDAGDAGVTSVVLEPDGKLLAGGYAKQGTDYLFALARYNANGTLDKHFGSSGNGRVITPQGTNDGINALALMPSGSILAAGSANDGGTQHPVIARYSSGGLLDGDFGGGDGVVAVPAGVLDYANAMALQPDGRILLGGPLLVGSTSEMAVARLNPDGTADNRFDGDGANTAAEHDRTAVGAIAVQRDGAIVAVGTSQPSTENDIAVARFVGDQTAPYDGRVLGTPRWSTSLKRTLFWQAGDDNTGVRSYDVRQRSAAATSSSYGAPGAVRTKTALTSGAFTAKPGRTYCFAARARDWAGNLGAYGAGSCTAYPVNDRALSASGPWAGLTGSAFYLGSARRSSTAGAQLSTAVKYRHLALVVTTCPGCGSVKVLLGSRSLGTFHLARSSTHHRVLIPVDSSLGVLSGTLHIRLVSGGKPVTVEGVAVSLA
jgi:uncharacterized delta-60 repeat protein